MKSPLNFLPMVMLCGTIDSDVEKLEYDGAIPRLEREDSRPPFFFPLYYVIVFNLSLKLNSCIN